MTGTSLKIYAVGSSTTELLETLEDLDELHLEAAMPPNGVPLQDRIFLISEAHLLVTQNLDGNQLVLHRLAMESPQGPIVTSLAPVSAAKGSMFRYPMVVVKSKPGAIRFTLENGPAGMAVSAIGEVTWNVPRDMGTGAQAAAVRLQDSFGHETVQRFSIWVE